MDARPDLLERDAPMALLTDALKAVRRHGDGHCVLVSGEAGIGKTALLRAFMEAAGAADCRLFAAGCEALHTPRPLGPLVDLARHLPPSVTQALHQGPAWSGLFPCLLDAFRHSGTATVLVIEDLHWADDATLDFVRYAGRRLAGVPLLMVLTHRSDDVAANQALRRVLGELPAPVTHRIELARLSPAAVARLAASSGRSGQRLYQATGGNPFYVTEILATHGPDLPASIHDAVLARMGTLSAAARDVAERVSLFPGHVEGRLLQALAPAAAQAIDECLLRGLLVASPGPGVAFRHELARDVVHRAIPPFRRAALHGEVFHALRSAGDLDAELARQVHHAEQAGLGAEVLQLAPRAAGHAAAHGAYRDAARMYELALAQQPGPDLQTQASLLESLAMACTMTTLHAQAISARSRLAPLLQALGNRRAEGINLRWMARLQGWSNSMPLAIDLARQAVDLLEALPPDAELAVAYSTLCHLNLVAERPDGIEPWGSRAIALAEDLAQPGALSHVLNNVGLSRLRLHDDPQGWQMLQRSLTLALQRRLDGEAALGYNNLHIVSLVHRHFAQAIDQASEGIVHCEARGIDVFTVRMRIRRAFAYLQTGQWDRAEADLDEVRQHHSPSPMELATGDFVQGLLDLRRGVDQAGPKLQRTMADMHRLDVRIWFASTAAAAAELAWLQGDGAAVEVAVQAALPHFQGLGDGWRAGELVAWQVRAGLPAAGGLTPAGPYALEAAGQPRQAARAWQDKGCAYEAALALCAGDEADLREALQHFQHLGALPAAEAVRRRLRSAGARAVPRGPMPGTLRDPLGLTVRERQVFDLLAQRLSNAAIAHRLHRSERTVEHHVAAVFVKLGIHSRMDFLHRFGLAAADMGSARAPIG